MVRMRGVLISLALFGLSLGCGGDSTGTGSGSANVKITGSSGSLVSVENIGGAGDYYLEFWAPHYFNPPPGTPNPVTLISSSPAVAVSPGYRGSVVDPISGTVRIVAKSRGSGGSAYFTSDCYGTGC